MNEQSRSQRGRIGFAVGALMLLGLVAAIVAISESEPASTGGGDGDEDLAFIEPLSGTTNGVKPDSRDGVDPEDVDGMQLEQAAAAAGCELQSDLAEEGSEHLPPDAPAPRYRTSPATSGDHSPEPQADGAYLESPSPLNVVHSLEHGRVALQYAPNVSDEDQLAVKGLFETDPDGVLLLPNPEMPYAVAATAWTRLLGCESYRGAATLAALKAFVEEYRGKGPEDVPVSL